MNKGYAPLLLLDDVFEKLDDNRMNQLLHWVCKENDGQVFITDTHEERLRDTFSGLDVKFQIIGL
jgi:DNA replication and repair protein RecF